MLFTCGTHINSMDGRQLVPLHTRAANCPAVRGRGTASRLHKAAHRVSTYSTITIMMTLHTRQHTARKYHSQPRISFHTPTRSKLPKAADGSTRRLYLHRAWLAYHDDMHHDDIRIDDEAHEAALNAALAAARSTAARYTKGGGTGSGEQASKANA